jgi:squalene-hopene/tetraprenyl-beta-curcumene cyclase
MSSTEGPTGPRRKFLSILIGTAAASGLLARIVDGQDALKPPKPPTRAKRPHLSAAEQREIDASVDKGLKWLGERQAASGAFEPLAGSHVCPVALTAMAVWAYSETGPGDDAKKRTASKGVRFLLRHRQANGGIYDRKRGLAVYTSGVAARALNAYRITFRNIDVQVKQAAASAELLAYRSGAPESFVDLGAKSQRSSDRSSELARELLGKRQRTPADTRRALEFLASLAKKGGDERRRPSRTRVPGWRQALGDDPLDYDDLLTAAYEVLTPEQQKSRRALAALERHYTLERNPDLTKRYGARGFQRGTQGIFYYYFIVAKTLALGGPRVRLRSGETKDWVRELSAKLRGLQQDDGRWVNKDEHWWENDPVLVTAYAVLALDLCATVGQQPAIR